MARVVISGKSVTEMESDESEDEIFVGRLKEKELLKLHLAGKKIPTVSRRTVISSPASKYSGVEIVRDNELSEGTSSDYLVHQSDTQTQESITGGRLEQSLEEDKSENRFFENLTKNCNVTERSVVGGRHASLHSENVDSNTKRTNANAVTNTDSLLCDGKLMSTDSSDGDNLMLVATFENATVDVQAVNSLQEDGSESVEIVRDNELSEGTSSDYLVHQSDTQTQESVTGGRLEQSLEEDKSESTFFENLTKNCNVTERSVVGGRHASLQSENVDSNTKSTNANTVTNTDSLLCDGNLMSTDSSDGDNLMLLATFENAAVDVQSVNSLQEDGSESIELVSDNELPEEINSNSLVHQSDTQSQEFFTGRRERFLEEDKTKNTFYENLTKNCNITERSAVGGRYTSLEAENIDTVTMRTDGNVDTNTDSLLCDEKLMSTGHSDGNNIMPVATFENATVDVQSVNSLQEDSSECIELISDNELSEEINSNSIVHQSDTQSQEFITGRQEQSLEEDKTKNTFSENSTKNCHITERSVVGGRHALLEADNVDTETTRTDGNVDTNSDSLLCDEKLMSTDHSDGNDIMPVATFENATVDVQSVNSHQEDVSESIELISDNELSEEINSISIVHQSDTQSQEFVTGRREQSLEEDKTKNTFSENSTKNCHITERSVVGGRHALLEADNVDTETTRTDGNVDTNSDSLLCDEKLMSTDHSDGNDIMPVATFENATVDVQSINSHQEDVSESIELISDNELSEEINSISIVHQSDTQSQEFVTGRREQSLEEDKTKNTFSENSTKNCHITERSVVGGRHALLEADNVDTETTRTDGNVDTNSDSLLCDEKLMSTDHSDGNDIMPVATFENATVDVQSINSHQEDVSESIELISDNELSEEINSISIVHQSDTQSQEFVTGRREQSLEEDKTKNTFSENSTKNCHITERSVVGGRHALLEADNVDTETTRTDGNVDTNSDSLLCDEKLMSTDHSDGNDIMPVATFENATVDVQSINSHQEDVSESIEPVSVNELSEEICSNSLVHQPETQSQDIVTGRLEQSLVEDKSKYTFHENLTKNCNITERFVVGDSHTRLQAENPDTESMKAAGNSHTNTGSVMCDEKLMSADISDGDSQMSVATFKGATVDVHSANFIQADVSEIVEIISDCESEEISSKSSVHQSDIQLQDFVTKRLEQSMEEDKNKNLCCENLMKNCNVTDRSVVGGRHTSLQAENVKIEGKRANGNRYRNTGSVQCAENLMSADRSDGDNQMAISTLENSALDLQSDVSENVEVKRDSELSQEISSKSPVQRSGTHLQEFVTGHLEQSLEEDKINSSFCENLTKKCSIIERSLVSSRHTSLQAENADIRTMNANGNRYTNMVSLLCDEKPMSADKSDGGIQMSVATLENATMGIQSENCLQAGVTERPELINNEELLTEASVVFAKKSLLQIAPVDITTKKTHGTTTAGVDDMCCHQVNISTNRSDIVDRITAEVCENLTINLQSPVFLHVKAFEGTDSECLFRSEVSAIVKDINELEELETRTSCDSSTSETCVSHTRTSPCASGTTYYPKEDNSSSDEDIHENTFEMMEKLLNGFEMKPDYACEVEMDLAHVNEVNTSYPYQEEVVSAHVREVEAGNTFAHEVDVGSALACDVEAGKEPAYAHAPRVEPDCVRSCKTEKECVRICEALPDCVPTCGTELDCVRTRDAEPDCVRARDAEPDCVRARDAEPDCVRARDAEPDCVRARDAEPDCERARDPEPDCERARDTEPDCVRARDPEPDCVRARDPEPDCVRARDPEPDCVRARGPEPDCVRARGPEPDCVRARGPEPDCVRARGPEPDCVRARGPEPDCVRARGPEPDCVRARGPEPDSVLARGPEPDSVLARGPEPDSVLARGPEPDSVLARGPEPECKPVFVVKVDSPLEAKLNSAGNSDIKAEVKSIKNILRESNSERFSLKRASGNILYPARCSKTPKREGLTPKMTRNNILPQSAGPIRKGRLNSVKSCVKEYLNSTQPPLFANVRNRNGYGLHQKALLSPLNPKKAAQECSTPSRTPKIILPPVSYTSSSAAKLDISKSSTANYVAEKCKKKIVPRSSPTVIKHAGRTVLPAKQWKQNGVSEGEVSVLLASEAVRSNTLKRTKKKE